MRAHSDGLKDQVTSLTGQAIKVEALFSKSRSTEKIELAKTETLLTEQLNILDHMLSLLSRRPSFQARVAEALEAGFFAFRKMLTGLLSDLTNSPARVSRLLSISLGLCFENYMQASKLSCLWLPQL